MIDIVLNVIIVYRVAVMSEVTGVSIETIQ